MPTRISIQSRQRKIGCAGKVRAKSFSQSCDTPPWSGLSLRNQFDGTMIEIISWLESMTTIFKDASLGLLMKTLLWFCVYPCGILPGSLARLLEGFP
jgi:hypothetical protein